jgi:hypothetical protein
MHQTNLVQVTVMADALQDIFDVVCPNVKYTYSLVHNFYCIV